MAFEHGQMDRHAHTTIIIIIENFQLSVVWGCHTRQCRFSLFLLWLEVLMDIVTVVFPADTSVGVSKPEQRHMDLLSSRLVW